MKHLVKERHDVTNRVVSDWCGADGRDAADDPRECTCEPCLVEAFEFGRAVLQRLADIRYAKTHGVEIEEFDRSRKGTP